ncbi:hypothetical protein ZIOFF_073862 [Zingiber officinale]|uniref:AP2/ERF domain-containing protein n=1 Tax=Zingiber officinale TaxID=94328 RepID=A0A8J5BCN6_ZINOF|nr:hypothetical protein ZIOFF_073862 [Zingiber officinale]
MKSMSNSDWLGFSLSSHMNTEVASESPHHNQNHESHRHCQSQLTATACVSASSAVFFHSSTAGLCYGGEEETAGLYSPLPAMPLKSDGSLGIMEAITGSQHSGILLPVQRKLEDFLGGGPTTGAHHHYGNFEREAIALSLDSLFYYQNLHAESALHDHQIPVAQHHQLFLQPEGMCGGLPEHELYQGPLEVGAMVEEDGLPSLKSWVARSYSACSNQLDEEGRIGSSSIDAVGFGELQSLSLSVSPVSQSSCITAALPISSATDRIFPDTNKKLRPGKRCLKQTIHRKSIDTFGQRTSQYRGVTRHRWTGRYEAHLWDNSCKREGQTRKGRQGGYDTEEKAARAYDLTALKYWGPSTHINFPLESYKEELHEMKNMSRQEYVAHLRRYIHLDCFQFIVFIIFWGPMNGFRKSSGFSRGASIYRGVTRHHQHGRWQARIGRVVGNKDLYLGTFNTQEEAAEAYDIAAIKFRGVNAVTNFDITTYDVEKIIASNTLLPAELARKTKATEAGKSVPWEKNICREPAEGNNISGSECKALCQSTEARLSTESCDHEPLMISGDYRSPMVSPAINGLIDLETGSSVQGIGDSEKMGNAHLSNQSSLVTSLASSREGSPDRIGLSILFSSGTPKLSPTPVASSIPAMQLRPTISITQMPVFAAWNDV